MSVTVTLFKGLSPNYGKHYKFFTSYADYIDSLLKDKTVSIITSATP